MSTPTSNNVGTEHQPTETFSQETTPPWNPRRPQGTDEFNEFTLDDGWDPVAQLDWEQTLQNTMQSPALEGGNHDHTAPLSMVDDLGPYTCPSPSDVFKCGPGNDPSINVSLTGSHVNESTPFFPYLPSVETSSQTPREVASLPINTHINPLAPCDFDIFPTETNENFSFDGQALQLQAPLLPSSTFHIPDFVMLTSPPTTLANNTTTFDFPNNPNLQLESQDGHHDLRQNPSDMVLPKASSTNRTLPKLLPKPAQSTSGTPTAQFTSEFSALSQEPLAPVRGARKRQRSVSPHVKRTRVPDGYINHFQAVSRPNTGEPKSGSKEKRTRSKTVCFRCQDQHLKCDGIFPCNKCRGIRRSEKIKTELPCIDADLQELNPFTFLILDEEILTLLGPKSNSNETSLFNDLHFRGFNPQVLYSAVERATKFLYTPEALQHTFLSFSYFCRTGLPACKSSTVIAGAPDTGITVDLEQSEYPNCGVLSHPTCSDKQSMSLFERIIAFQPLKSFVVLLFHRETLWPTLHSNDRAREHCVFLVMLRLLNTTKRLLAKWRNRQADITSGEKIWLAQALVVLLVAADMREPSPATDVLKAFLRSRTHEHSDEHIILIRDTILRLLLYTGSDLTVSGHLRRCIRHLLRRLFVGDGVPSSVYEMGLFVAAASNIKFRHDSRESYKSSSDLLSDGFLEGIKVVGRLGLGRHGIEFLRAWDITITSDELTRRMDFATFQGLDGIFPERPLATDAWHAMLKKERDGLPAEYFNDDWSIERSRPQKGNTDAERDPVEVGRRRNADSRETPRAIALAMFKRLFVGWLEQGGLKEVSKQGGA